LKLTKKVHVVDDDEVDAHLKTIQKRSAELKSVEEDRSVKDTDVVIIDFEGFRDGKPFEPTRKTENFQVEIGSGQILPDFEKQLVGMSCDSNKEMHVRFPEDYFNKELAGLEVDFEVTLKEIKEEILPDLDDEFAKDIGEYETIEALKKAIRDKLGKVFEEHSERRLREEVTDRLIEQVEFELPQGLVETEVAEMSKGAQDIMAQQGLDLDNPEQELLDKYRPMAERKVREYLLLEKVITQQDIALTDEMLEEAYQELSDLLAQPVDAVKAYHNANELALDALKHKTLQKQAIRHIIENGELETVEVDKEDLVIGPSESS
jgi:trigger factor